MGTPQKPKVNPNFSIGGDYANNCGYCSVAFEMRRRGFDVEANPKNNLLVSQWERMFNDFIPNVLLDNNMESALPNMIKDIESWGNGARGTIFGAWNGRRIGHFFNFEVVDGKCIFVDPQNGQYNVIDYFNDMTPASIVYGRTDNLELSDMIKNACKNKE